MSAPFCAAGVCWVSNRLRNEKSSVVLEGSVLGEEKK